MSDLDRFKTAQDAEAAGFAAAVAELRQGRKQGHWIWYVFPQLAGLGSSAASRTFGIRDIEEAEAYVRDDLLRTRLLTALEAVTAQLCRIPPPSLEIVMESRLDALKLVSSLTLFESVAARLHAREPHEACAQLADRAGEVLAMAEAQGYERCAFTRRALRAAS